MRSILCLALLAAAVAQGQQQQQAGNGINFYSRQAEIAAGQKMAQEFRGRTTPLANEAIGDYVNRLGAKLAAQFHSGWTYQFETIRENTGGATHEPAAFPGGPIFVSAELIAAARNEAEFAGMVAHAMAHVAARHWTRMATRYDLLQLDMQPTALDFQGRPAVVPLGMLQFQRAFERQADYLAVVAMSGAGYDPAALATYLERVQPGKSGAPGVFDPLPPRDERVKAIRRAIGQLPARVYEAGDQFARVQGQVTSH